MPAASVEEGWQNWRGLARRSRQVFCGGDGGTAMHVIPVRTRMPARLRLRQRESGVSNRVRRIGAGMTVTRCGGLTIPLTSGLLDLLSSPPADTYGKNRPNADAIHSLTHKQLSRKL